MHDLRNLIKRGKKGFSLTEILMIIGIVAVILIIAMPVFRVELNKAKADTCAANRHSLKGVLSITFVSDGAQGVEQYYEKKKDSFCCPVDGRLSYMLNPQTGVVCVTCSAHGGDGGDSGWNQETLAKLQKVTGEILENKTGTARLNSGGCALKKSAAGKMQKMLNEQGIDLEKMGAVSWRYERNYSAAKNQNTEEYLYWTPVDIRGMEIGTKLPVICCDLLTGRYTVWVSTIQSHTIGTGAEITEYRTLWLLHEAEEEGYAPSVETDTEENQCYVQALTYFNQLMQSAEYKYIEN